MGSAAPETLPIISIASWLPSSDASATSRAETASALHDACLRYGFFYLDITTFASREETDELEALARRFFSLDQAKKDEISISKGDHARGYQRLNENVTLGKADSHEGLDLYAPVADPDPKRPLWGENQWPLDSDVPGFRAKYERWVDRMKELGLIVMEAMAAGLGATSEEWADLRAQVDDSFWVLRVIGYPPLPAGHDGISCGAHKDYGCLTFLYTDTTRSALQVFRAGRAGQSGEWIHADPVPGCIVVNIGEMWEIWTAGLYKSTLHRVIHQGENYRVSIPFFFEPNFEAIVKPLPAALRLEAIASSDSSDQGDVRRKPRKTYAPVKYGDFLTKKVTNNFATGEKY